MVVNRTNLNLYHVKVANLGSKAIAQDYQVLAQNPERAEEIAKGFFKEEYKQCCKTISVDRNATRVIVDSDSLATLV